MTMTIKIQMIKDLKQYVNTIKHNVHEKSYENTICSDALKILAYLEDVLDLENRLAETEEHCKRFNNKYIDKKDKIVEQVIDKFRVRSKQGIEKYGTTLADNNLTLDEWLTHAQEEAMDFVVYLEKIKSTLKDVY